MNMSNNKSRPEQSFAFADDTEYKQQYNLKAKKKSLKAFRPLKQKKYFPGEFIYDTKGQMAEIKYVGECHKGPGVWFGIEFVDGTLGKHNGTINGHTYFRGEYRRCDMIRGLKIRSKYTPHKTKHKSTKRNKRNHNRARANSDLSKMQSGSGSVSVSLCNFSDNYLQQKRMKNNFKHKKHKRNASQPTQLMSQMSRENDKIIHNNANINASIHRQYQKKLKQTRTVKKEKYKGNKYILAMEQETEKRKHERIGLIKTEKRRVKKQKHERNSSRVQQILKRKEFEKEQLLKLNEENKLKEMQRIQAAKRKSKRRRNRSRIRCRSNSDVENQSNKYKKHNIRFHTPDINKMNRGRSTPIQNINIPHISIVECKDIEYDNNNNSNDLLLKRSTTPLADMGECEFEFDGTPIPSETEKNKNGHDVVIDDMRYENAMDENDESFDDMEHSIMSGINEEQVMQLPRSYSESDSMLLQLPKKNTRYNMGDMFPVNSDSAIILQELSMIESDECPSPMNVFTPKTIKKESEMSDDMKESESESDRDTNFNFPMFYDKKQRSNSCGSRNLLKRSHNSPILNCAEDMGTDYWIKKYNKINERFNDTQDAIDRQIKLMTNEHENHEIIHDIPKPDIIAISKSAELKTKTNKNNNENEEENDTLYYPMCNDTQHIRERSQSLTKPSLLKRTESAPLVVNDDKGTDYWIKQYNKENKKKAKTKKKGKSKSKRKKMSRSKTVANLAKNNQHISIKSKTKTEYEMRINKINKPGPISPYFISDISEIDDIATDICSFTSTATLSSHFSNDAYDTKSLDSITINSTISSISSISSLMSSPLTSAESTPDTNNNSANSYADFDLNINLNITKALQNVSYQSKYGVYPFKRTYENYINKKFTGIVRIGHRYLLRDGRIGIVRYVNNTRFAPGIWIGFELDKADGEHNGTVHKTKYFSCHSRHGAFVKKSQIAQYIGRDNTKSLNKNLLKRLNIVQKNNNF